ncbi:MAG: 1,4-dihydroxy-6-naphthoate synthase [Pirellulaceae bacterium]|jgi:1,4-dihydroxy-6-naphthoate synthase|nr:1,4-dihydroxy-6-naphthoate synthase [Pirellulaceae bacterium]
MSLWPTSLFLHVTQNVTTLIRLGISTCPNDTFTFHGLMTRAVDWRGLEFDIELIDIQQLNDGLFRGEFDVTKASFHAALLLADKTVVLPSGSALGFGVGPLLLSATRDTTPSNSDQLTLCPGQHTTGALLFQLFHAGTTRIEHVVFSDIMPKLQQGGAEFGVCIHEGRFTWQEQGLGLVEDLGTRWEAETDCPLPLGGIIAQRALPPKTIATVQAVIRDSLDLALADPMSALPSMRKYAQELDDAVLWQHVDLYVNQWTHDLGNTGRAALQQFSDRALATGLADDATTAIEVFGD